MMDAFIYQPLFSVLIFFYHLLNNNLGLAIILVTLTIRLLTYPLTLPAMKSAQKIKNLKPQLDELKRKFKTDPKRLQQEQLALYQQHQINPASGCLPYIVQFIILIGLYHVFINSLQNGQVNGVTINTEFLWLNLSQPDASRVLPIIAGVTQLILSAMIAPGADTAAEKTLALQTTTQSDDNKAEDMEKMAATMQQQMLFVMPLVTTIIAFQFPAGLALYWIITTLFSIMQQYHVSGPGGLVSYKNRLLAFLPKGRL